LGAQANAADAIFNVDLSESRVAFTIGDALHTVHGAFRVKRASIHFDPSGTASGEIVVDATSGDSGNGIRDKRMHQSILESQKFPEIVFIPSRIRGNVSMTGESKVEIDGTFTIHGASHPLTASAQVIVSGGQMHAKVHFPVPYVAWGMKNPSNLFVKVGETVDIDLDASGNVVWPR
jgi:polyisoprenoid-binding protein YceI